ncbi:Acid-sensing ion channel 1 [Holothuria leucospilota]|uniref:Acid-sensing ion channel 1 n=1 Tax=Holothuria leucospilota TaxID=206669 RepID=A0A9Q1H4M6_HOLLE|nr:Acid-sensing ion channel 1 [Holothuria leucospilota]
MFSFNNLFNFTFGLGLHLTLNIEENEYVGSFTEGTGIRVMVHPSDILPHPEDVGLSVSPGLSTNIGIRQVEIRRLDAPHGDCTDGKGHEYLQNDTYSYSIISCQKKCLLDKMVSTCNCTTNIYDDYSGVPFCTGKTQTNLYITCRQRRPFGLPNNTTANLVRLKIYFQELNYELVEQVPANTIESVLGTTGGLLGLYIGFSVITISEIFVLIYDVFAFLLKRK